MKKKSDKLFLVFFIVFLFPISYFSLKDYINFDNLSAIFFVFLIAFLIIRNRKKLDFQVMLGISKIPIIYAVLWKTKFGLKLMEKISSKYRETVKLLGYCGIGFGFLGMAFISVNILFMLFKLFSSPKEASEGVSLVLPLTNIPGLGYLPFWHFLITIFITVLIHEFAHGVVARAHNVPVKASGLGIFSIILPLFPLAFVEPEEEKLKKERDVVQYSIFAAGPIINIVFAVFIMIITMFVITPIENNITHPVGFSYGSLMEDYPAKEAGMAPGMIINSVNGKEYLNYQDFSNDLGIIAPGENLTIGTNNGTFLITAKPSPDDESKGYIGILGIQNERRVNEEFKSFGNAFFWIKGLIKWLYILNLIIGLMNLLPLMITDGGRMLKVALDKIFKDSNKANKIWTFIGLLFIFTLLSALVIKYGLQLFSLFGLG